MWCARFLGTPAPGFTAAAAGSTASAAGFAGLLKCHTAGNIPKGSTVVVTVTGHGLKDPRVAVENSLAESTVVDADLDSVLAAIGLD